MKYALRIRVPGLLHSKPRIVDRLCSEGLECPHTTRKSAERHAEAYNHNARSNGLLQRADVVKL